jgi:branched-chain amino acid transport system ATP-binding protein
MTALFQARGVSVRYGAVKALTDVDVSVDPGQVHGIIGPNGAGKSTLIDALSGRRRMSSGMVSFEGADITRQSPTHRRRIGIARSFQRTSVFPSMTVREQLEMVARKNDEENLQGIIDAVELNPVLDIQCSQIAYGTQRSVDLALALIGDPKVVLLDEPCAGLVHEESVRLLEHVRRLCTERKVGVILVEHDVDGVFRTCDVVSVLNLGQLLISGEPAEVRKDSRVIEAYLGTAA